MSELKPIPLSKTTILYELRHKFVPIFVFGLALVTFVLMMRNFTVGGQTTGIGEGARSIVASPQVARIQSLNVNVYEWVQAGEPLAILEPIEPRNSLSLLQSELTVARMKLEPSMADRNAIDFERVHLDYRRMQQDLAIAQVNLERAEKVLRRNQELIKEKLVTADDYDFSLNERDMYKADVANKQSAVEELRGRLETLRPMSDPQMAGTNQLLAEVLSTAEGQLKEARKSVGAFVLTAPISGMVQSINRRQGEYVTEGEPLLTIVSEKADRIVAYLRQPYDREPTLGQAVEVRTRTYKRKSYQTQVVEVGAQFEAITNALAFLKPGGGVDSGLPVILKVPSEAKIRPGEVVDIVFLDDPPSPGPAVKAN